MSGPRKKNIREGGKEGKWPKPHAFTQPTQSFPLKRPCEFASISHPPLTVLPRYISARSYFFYSFFFCTNTIGDRLPPSLFFLPHHHACFGGGTDGGGRGQWPSQKWYVPQSA